MYNFFIRPLEKIVVPFENLFSCKDERHLVEEYETCDLNQKTQFCKKIEFQMLLQQNLIVFLFPKMTIQKRIF